MVFQDLSKRFFVSLIAIIGVALLLVYAFSPFIRWINFLIVALLGSIGVWEYSQLTCLKESKKDQIFMILLVILEIFLLFCAQHQRYGFLFPFGALALGGMGLFLMQFNRIENSSSRVALAFFGVCYLAVPLGLLLNILIAVPTHVLTPTT